MDYPEWVKPKLRSIRQETELLCAGAADHCY